jgi:sulfur relay (sulfurtransferase) complex TusBCD TusD component (DsrE family)
MTLQELQKQVLGLPTSDRWQLVQTLLESLKREAHPKVKCGNLSRLRGIAKSSVAMEEVDAEKDYVAYLTEKYQ